MSDLGINWGAYNQAIQSNNVGESFQAGFDRGQELQARRLTGEAIQALMADPNGGQEQINKLARIAPDKAQALLNFRYQQQERRRDADFREASGRYLTAGGGGVLNALMPPTAGQGVLGAAPPTGAPSLPPSSGAGALSAAGGVAPPISAAPAPPANWQETLGPGTVNALAALRPPAPLPTEPATPPSAIRPIDPNTALGAGAIDPYASRGIGAESGVTGQYAPQGGPQAAPAATPAMGGAMPQGATDTFDDMPEPIRRAANSPNMNARNAAFVEMVKIDPLRAMKVDSEMRDAMLDRLEDANKAYQLAVARLPNVHDDASYQRVLNEVDQLLAPMGMDIRQTVPATYPGPEGTRQLLMQAMDAQQQMAAIDRRFTAEANKADDEADNAREDRKADAIIADRNRRTDIADRREVRMAAGGAGRGGRGGSGGGKRGAKVRPGEAVAKGPNGERMVVRGGKWVPAQ